MKDRPLRIAVADDEPVMQMYLEETLSDFGHEVVAVAKDGRELVEKSHSTRPDLIITDIKMPTMDGLTAIREVYRHRPVPVVVVTGYNSLESVGAEGVNMVLVFLVKPIGEAELRGAIDTALRRYGEFELLVEECGGVGHALECRRVVERAKELLSHRHGLSETEAFGYLREMVGGGFPGLVEAAEAVVRETNCA